MASWQGVNVSVQQWKGETWATHTHKHTSSPSPSRARKAALLNIFLNTTMVSVAKTVIVNCYTRLCNSIMTTISVLSADGREAGSVWLRWCFSLCPSSSCNKQRVLRNTRVLSIYNTQAHWRFWMASHWIHFCHYRQAAPYYNSNIQFISCQPWAEKYKVITIHENLVSAKATV